MLERAYLDGSRADLERAELAEVEMSFRDDGGNFSKSFPVRDRVNGPPNTILDGRTAPNATGEWQGVQGRGYHDDRYGA